MKFTRRSHHTIFHWNSLSFNWIRDYCCIRLPLFPLLFPKLSTKITTVYCIHFFIIPTNFPHTTFILKSNTFGEFNEIVCNDFRLGGFLFSTKLRFCEAKTLLFSLVFVRTSIEHKIKENLITRIHTWRFLSHRFVLLLIFAHFVHIFCYMNEINLI